MGRPDRDGMRRSTTCTVLPDREGRVGDPPLQGKMPVRLVPDGRLAYAMVKEQDREICLEAVKQDCWALKYVKKQDKSICLLAIKQDIETIK
ncbi:MAG: DUF4116 domain-containing protein, partial [Oscillospiraceae bacterium]|nr:DUF4116 domain-containing protein [Oscillospiraceae bacterium]